MTTSGAVALSATVNSRQGGLVRKRQGPQQHALDDGKDCGGGSDIEGQRQNGGQRESLRFAQPAKGVMGCPETSRAWKALRDVSVYFEITFSRPDHPEYMRFFRPD
jgi:hypothetical protein